MHSSKDGHRFGNEPRRHRGIARHSRNQIPNCETAELASQARHYIDALHGFSLCEAWSRKGTENETAKYTKYAKGELKPLICRGLFNHGWGRMNTEYRDPILWL